MQQIVPSSVVVRSPLRWAGSKRQLLPVLQSYWGPEHGRYLEAFAGSAALFFNLRPSAALLNDTNNELIGALNLLKTCPRLLHESITELPVSSEYYYRLRSSSVEKMDSFERALRFFYLNRNCFNGIYRTNSRGDFNVPFSSSASSNIPSIDQWMLCSELLKQASLYSNDFERFILEQVQSDDFVYLDPPYAVSNRRIFTQYSAQTFGLQDIKRLSSVLKEIDRRGATFLVSYAQSPETEELARGWNVERRYAQRNIAGFAMHRRRAMEVLISNKRPKLQD